LNKIKQGENISPEVIKIIRIFIQRDWKILSRLKIPRRYQEELKSISEKYLSLIKEEQGLLNS
jgi:hypothetical protein